MKKHLIFLFLSLLVSTPMLFANGVAENATTSSLGYVTEDITDNKDQTITITVLSGQGKETLTTKTLTAETFALLTTKNQFSNDMKVRKGTFVELIKDNAGNLVTFNKLFQPANGQFFEMMKYGPEFSSHANIPGNMIASGWVLDKTANTVTLGDGNKFTENYSLAPDVQVYCIDSEKNTIVPATLDSLPVTKKIDGVYWKTADRQQAVVVFDTNYLNDAKAKVVQLFYITPQTVIPKDIMIAPDDMPNGSFFAENGGKSHAKPNTYPSYTSTEPFEIVPGKMYFVGDNEVAMYLFNTSKGLVLLDSGWPNSGYQYWRNIEKMGFNPRDIDYILLTHGHADHYGTTFELDRMIKNAGGNPIVYESYEDDKGYDIYGYPDIKGLIADQEVLQCIDKYYVNDTWMDFGNIRIYPTVTAGHTKRYALFYF
ncbi:MBL fold metallo-hydrolase [uncultured Sphaerochaeta sp.]|uniref:MBL fold metallo-hydrolase n=1 Tax=uncultured Sphaerochaeta sp. TaxID=886478 RepID=UPI002A0A1419|nr:MBL fold metallo-hydrolase [uncultured Sphaerochaeta sp.]